MGILRFFEILLYYGVGNCLFVLIIVGYNMTLFSTEFVTHRIIES